MENKNFFIKNIFNQNSFLEKVRLNTSVEYSYEFSKKINKRAKNYSSTENINYLINNHIELNDEEKYLFHQLNTIVSSSPTLTIMNARLKAFKNDVVERNLTSDIVISAINGIVITIHEIEENPALIDIISRSKGGDEEIDWRQAINVGLASGLANGAWGAGTGAIAGGATGLVFGPGGAVFGGVGGLLSGAATGFLRGFIIGFSSNAFYQKIQQLELDENADKKNNDI